MLYNYINIMVVINVCLRVPFRHDELIRREVERTERENLVMDSVTGLSINDRKKPDFW